jgi:hypothetical protein
MRDDVADQYEVDVLMQELQTPEEITWLESKRCLLRMLGLGAENDRHSAQP